MKITQRPQQPFLLNRVISSLSTQGEPRQSSWEQSLSDRIQKQQKQQSMASRGQHGCFIPNRKLVRDLNTGSASAGGNLIAESLAAVAEAVRPVSVLEAAGVERIEVDGENFSLPRFTKADTSWIAEGDAVPALNTATTSVSVTPRLAYAQLGFSRKLLLQANDIENAVTAEVARAVSGLIEHGAINGTGTNAQPLGLLNIDGALSKTFGAATPTSSELVDMLELVSLQDVDLNKLVWVVNPAMAANLRRSEISSGSGELILNYDNGYRLHGVPVAMTTNMPSGKVLLMEPSFTKLVYFGSAEVLVDPYRNATTGHTNVQVFNHVDVAVTYPESICVGSS